MPPFGVVGDGVVGAHADPLRDRLVLLGFLRQCALGPERFLRRLTGGVSRVDHLRYMDVVVREGTYHLDGGDVSSGG